MLCLWRSQGMQCFNFAQQGSPLQLCEDHLAAYIQIEKERGVQVILP